jgi:putative SOS response-associated peptidase YedK
VQPGAYELIEVITKRGVTRTLLFPKAILRAEFEAEEPLREALAIKRERLLARRVAKQRWPHYGGLRIKTSTDNGPDAGLLSDYIALMCGRFTRHYTWQQIQALYRLTTPAAIPNLQPLYNVCPTDPADVVVPNGGGRELVEMRWGLVPYWWNKPLKELRLATFNARVETVTTKPFFREPFKKKRCLIPVSGYYEWEDTSGGKQPHYFTAHDGSPVMTIAGLWDGWKNRETGERIKSCAMIITEPNKLVAEVHDRMPVILQPDNFDHWLSGNMSVAELQPAPTDYLQRWAVSKRVNSSKADKDDATLIEPVMQAA